MLDPLHLELLEQLQDLAIDLGRARSRCARVRGSLATRAQCETREVTPEEFRKFGHQTVDWMASYLAAPERFPVLPAVLPGALVDALP